MGPGGVREYPLHLVWTETCPPPPRAPWDEIGVQRRKPPSPLPSTVRNRPTPRPPSSHPYSVTEFCQGLTRTRRHSGSNSLRVSHRRPRRFCRAQRPRPSTHFSGPSLSRVTQLCRALTKRLPTRVGGHWQGRCRFVQLDS